jgi:hypothetical protein
MYVARYLTHAQVAQLLTKLTGLPSAGPWYPKWATVNDPGPSEQVTVADREMTVDSWGAEHRSFHVGPGHAGDARIRTFYYPLWIAAVEGKALPTRADSDGAMLISLPAEAVSVDLALRRPVRYRVAAAVGLVCWIFILFLFVQTWRRSPSHTPIDTTRGSKPRLFL